MPVLRRITPKKKPINPNAIGANQRKTTSRKPQSGRSRRINYK